MSTTGDQLANELTAHATSGSRAAAGRFRATIEKAQEAKRSETRALPTSKPKAMVAPKEPLFPNARPLSALLSDFKGMHAADAATVAPLPPPSSSSSSSSLPSTHSVQAPVSTEFDRDLFSRYVAERAVEMAGLVAEMCPAPARTRRHALDVAFVRRLLSEPYGGFSSCTSQSCVGYSLPGKFALMAYVSPEQMQHYDLTGQIPESQEPLCYLCVLTILATVVDIAASAKAGLRTIQAPFFHPINAPGGYLPHAMHRSALYGSTVPITHPFRHVDLSEFVEDERTVWVAEDHSAETGWATKWAIRTVRGYSERADLMFGSHDLPAITQLAAPICIVGVGELPACEQLLADKFLSPTTLIDVPVATIENESVNALKLPTPLLTTLGGATIASTQCKVPAQSAHPQEVLWSLCFSDLMVARARLIHIINRNGNHAETVAKRYGLVPSAHQHFTMDSPHAIEARYSFKLHMVFYLVLTRLNQVERLLLPKGERPLQMDPPPAMGDRDMVETVLAKPGIEAQLRAYKAALSPLLEFFIERMRNSASIEDTVFFAPGARVLRWFELRPSPAPDYFSPTDLAGYPLDVASVITTSPGRVAGAAVNSLPPATREAAPMELYSGVFEPFRQSVTALSGEMPAGKAPCMAYWQPRADYFVFHVTPDVALTLGQVCGDELDEPQCDAWTEALCAALAGTNAHIWRAIVYRINVASWLIHRSAARLATIDQELATMADRSNSWLPAQYTSEIAKRVYTEHAASTTHLDLAELVVRVMRNMPRITEAAETLIAEHRQLTALMQALKQFMASHVPLVCTAIMRRAVSDDDMRPLLSELLPSEVGAPGAVSDASMMCMASEVDGIEFLHDMPDSSIYSWVMSGVVPTSARVSDFVARHREAMAASEEYELFAHQALYAHLVGLYPHARNVAPFHVWVRAHLMLFAAPTELTRTALDFYLDGQETRNEATGQVESGERVFFLALREHLVRTLDLAPAYQMWVMASYPSYSQFADYVRRHAEHLRSTSPQCSLSGGNAVLLETYSKSSQPWPTYHRPPPSFPAFMAECCKAVDIDRAIEACEKARAVLSADELRPDALATSGIGAYVESNVLPHEVYREQWMRDIGLSDMGVAAMNRLYAEHLNRAVNTAQGVVKLGRLASQRPIDYQAVAIFFTTMQAHIRRRVIPLDMDMTLKQQDALNEQRNMAGVEHAGQCVLSSVQCCDMMRTFVIQDGGHQGTLPMRLNLDTGRKLCVTKRGKQYAPNRPGERDTNAQNIRLAMKAYFELLDSPTRTDNDRGELDERHAAMHTLLRSYVQTLSKSRYSLSCGTMEVSRWPALGYVTIHGDKGCTVCPRCGNKTTFSPGMFSSNMFTCGHCDTAMQDALDHIHDERCAMCMQTKKQVQRAMRFSGADRRWNMRDAVLEVIDDTAAEDVWTYREAWVCAMCNSERWVAGAAASFTLSELRWLRGRTDIFRRQLSELVDPQDWETMRRDVRRAKEDARVQFPKLQTVSSIPKTRRVKRRMGTQRV